MSMTTQIRQIFLIGPALLLAACAQTPQSPATADPVSGVSGGLKVASIAGSGSRSASPSGKISEPARLKGLTPVQVQQVLGQPGFQRHDSPAEIWQYRGQACILDLYIYDQGQGKTVDHWAVRSPARQDDTECFQQLVAQGHPQSGS